MKTYRLATGANTNPGQAYFAQVALAARIGRDSLRAVFGPGFVPAGTPERGRKITNRAERKAAARSLALTKHNALISARFLAAHPRRKNVPAELLAKSWGAARA